MLGRCDRCSEGFGFHLPWCQLPDSGLRQQTSQRACLPAAFGIVLGIEPSTVLVELGRGDDKDFHVLELVWWARLKHGRSFIPLDADVELDPVACKAEGCVRGYVTRRGSEGYLVDDPCRVCGGFGALHEETSYLKVPKIDDVLPKYSGVMCGKPVGKDNYHAVAWDKETQRVRDPNYTTYGRDGFVIDTFWALVE